MAAHGKSIDNNHLLETSLEGFYGSSDPEKLHLNPNFNTGTYFIANNQIPGIDFAIIHAYPNQWLSNINDQFEHAFVNSWLTSHIEDAQNILHKPLLFAEFGKSDKDPGFSTYQRDQLFADVYSNLYSSAKKGGAGAGGLFWQLLTEGIESYGNGYTIVLSKNPSNADLIACQSRSSF